MYAKKDILELEIKILAIFTYYSYVQISFNNSCQSKNKDISDIRRRVGNAKLEIEALRSLVFKLIPIKYHRPVDYSVVSTRLFYLGSKSRKHKLHTNKIIWGKIIDVVKQSSFSAVFGHFISRLRSLENMFNNIENKYNDLSLNETKKFEGDLLSLSTHLQDFISYIQAVKIMLEYIDKNNIIENASHEEIKKTIRKKPVLRLIKSAV